MAGAGMSYTLKTALGSLAEGMCFNWLERPPVWLLGGSCGLLLHGVPLSAAPRDIDLYCDLEDAERLHAALSTYVVREPEADYSGGCFSVRSSYIIAQTKVELICGFQLGFGDTRYTLDINRLRQYAPWRDFNDIGLLRLMPLSQELIFNMLRGRVERCVQIASLMRQDLSAHLPLLQNLILGNGLDVSFQTSLEKLLEISSLIQI